jgi:hypothetical protein
MCETFLFSRVYNVAAILCLQWMVYVALFPAISVLNFHITASRSISSGQNIIDFFWFFFFFFFFFCFSMSHFPFMFLGYFLNDFQMVPFAPIITGITFIFTFHSCISIIRFLHFKVCLASILITFLCTEILK